jgi:hypothetical protein
MAAYACSQWPVLPSHHQENWHGGVSPPWYTTPHTVSGKRLSSTRLSHDRSHSDHALLALIAYLRTLTPIENDVPDHQLDFPLSLIVNVIPLARRTAHR